MHEIVIKFVSFIAPWEVALQIVGYTLGIVATVVAGKFVSKWAQAYRTAVQKSETEDVKIASQNSNISANQESDKLKEIEGR